MRNTLLAFIFIVLISACGNQVPNGIIEQDKMEPILYDVHVVDGYVSNVYPPDSAKKVSAAYYIGIYNKFGIDSTSFTESLTYYSKHPLILEEMYKRIASKLNVQKKYMARQDSLEVRKAFIADSLKLKKKAKEDSIIFAKKAKADLIKKKRKPKLSALPKKKKNKKKITSVQKGGF